MFLERPENTVSHNEFKEVRRQLQKFGYFQPLESLANALNKELWLVGGWVRSAFLGRLDYAGDVDCVCTLPEDEIVARLSAASVSFSRNRNNGIRTPLFDKNYVDIIPVEHLAATGAIEDALRCFNFSVNSAAFRIAEGVFQCVPPSLEDLGSRTFRLNDGYMHQSGQRRVLFEDAEKLRHHYKLTPATHKPTADLLFEIEREKQIVFQMSLSEKLESARRQIYKVFGSDVRAWIVRGYLRCSLLGELEYWDDLDVVVDLKKRALFSSIERNGCRYIENYFGNAKIFLDDGAVMDAWSLPDGIQIKDELAGYSHNMDMIAWDVQSGAMVDPLGFEMASGAREVEIMEPYIRTASKEELAYTTFKTAYLCLRHNAKPGPMARELLRDNVLVDGFLHMNVSRLAKELSCAKAGRVRDPLSALKADLRDSPVLEFMTQFFAE